MNPRSATSSGAPAPDGIADFLTGLNRQHDTAARIFQSKSHPDSTVTTPTRPPTP